jgi:hypothetical protein
MSTSTYIGARTSKFSNEMAEVKNYVDVTSQITTVCHTISQLRDDLDRLHKLLAPLTNAERAKHADVLAGMNSLLTTVQFIAQQLASKGSPT